MGTTTQYWKVDPVGLGNAPRHRPNPPARHPGPVGVKRAEDAATWCGRPQIQPLSSLRTSVSIIAIAGSVSLRQGM